MQRPLPTLPRGPRRPRVVTPEARRQLLLACPRIAPDWELGALRALMKPHDFTRDAIAHRPAEQPWPAGAEQVIAQVRAAVRQRVGFDPRPHFPQAGDFRMVCRVDERDADAARAFALAASKRLPGVWLTVDRLYVRDGRFHRRERGNKFRIVETSGVHLPRPLRAALRGLL